MGKSTPATPDYASLAQQQGAANLETARAEGRINRPDIHTPNGSQTWTVDPNNPDHYILTESYNPQLTDNNNTSNWIQGAALGSLAQYGVPALDRALSQQYQLPGQAQLGWDPSLAPDQRMQTESGMWAAPAQQESLNFSGAPGMPTASDATRQSAQDALYGRQTQYLDPQFAGKRSDLEAKLANQGIAPGSEAYAGAMQQLSQEEQQAYGSARMDSIVGGGNEMAQQFGLGMQARQQGTGEIAQQGTFANQSRDQLISQLMNDMAGRNAALTGQANIASAQQQASAGGRAAGLAELAQQMSLPVNTLAALLGAGQVNAPTYQPFNNNIQVGQTPVYQAGRDTYQANLNSSNASNAGVGNAVGAAGSIAAMFL